MIKALTLLNLAVLSLSAMTTPVFAQSAKMPMRIFQMGSSGLIRSHPTFPDYGQQNYSFYRGQTAAPQQLLSPRSSGFWVSQFLSPGR
jgi:hypothetical protein